MVTWVSNRDGKVLSSTPDRAAADDHGPVPDLGEVRRLSVGPHRLAGQSHDGRVIGSLPVAMRMLSALTSQLATVTVRGPVNAARPLMTVTPWSW